MADKMVVRSLAIQKFAELEGIEVSAEDVDAEVENLLQHTSDERVRPIINSPSTRESLGRSLSLKKTLDRLIEISTGGEASVTSEEESATSSAKKEESENGDATE